MVSIGVYVVVTFPKFRAFRPRQRDFLIDAVFKPIAAFIPFVGAVIAWSSSTSLLPMVASFMISIFVAFRLLHSEDRVALNKFSKKVSRLAK